MRSGGTAESSHPGQWSCPSGGKAVAPRPPSRTCQSSLAVAALLLGAEDRQTSVLVVGLLADQASRGSARPSPRTPRRCRRRTAPSAKRRAGGRAGVARRGPRRACPSSCLSSIRRWSSASSPIGFHCSMISMTCSAASAIASYSTITSVRIEQGRRQFQLDLKRGRRRCDSVPTSARATLKPRSGAARRGCSPRRGGAVGRPAGSGRGSRSA